jgi:hypothetical protein
LCVNCGNKLHSSYTVNYYAKCGRLIKNEKLKYTSDGKPNISRSRARNISTKITEIQSKGLDDGTSKSKGTAENSTKGNNYQSGWGGIIFIILFIIITAIVIRVWILDSQRKADILVWTEVVFLRNIISA